MPDARGAARALSVLAALLAALLATSAAPSPAGAAADPAASVTIGWVGDTVLGSSFGVPPARGRGLLRAVRADLRRPDVMIGNLEGTFSVGGSSKCGPGPSRTCFAFQAPPRSARTLGWAGFDVMSLANNHAFDFGPGGFAQTLAALRRARVASTGMPGRIAVLRRRGVRVAVVGFAPYRWAAPLLDLRAAAALVRRAARRADVVVATMHAGAEGASRIHTPRGPETFLGERRGDPRRFARAVIDAGADVVVGSGPHVVRGLERYRGRVVAYSTGNFVGYRTFSTAGLAALSGMVELTVDARGRPTAGRWISLRLVGPGRPVRDWSRTSGRLVARLSRQDFGRTALPPGPRGVLALRGGRASS